MSNGPNGNSAAGAAPSVGSDSGSSATSTPSTPSGTSSEGQGDFGFMTDTGTDTGMPSTQPVSTPVAEPPAPQAPPTVQPPAPAPAQPAPPVAPVEPGAPPSSQQGAPTGQQSASPQFDPADPISLARALVEPENYNAAIEHLAQTQFRLEPGELEGLQADLATAVPRLLARTAVYLQAQFLTQLSRVVPLQIQRHNQIMERQGTNLGKFYSAWPSVDKGQHNAKVMELATRYRQMFPNATTDQMISQLGPLVLMELGLPIVAQAQGKPVTGAAPKPNGQAGRPVPPAGFVPAAPGTVSQVTTVPDDPFAYMGQQGE